MNSFLFPKFQWYVVSKLALIVFVAILFCPTIWAAQDALVVAEKAIIYSDQSMTSPVGYILRGKKISVGEIARNKSQVYPIIVSGRIAYIRVLDISTEKESMGSARLTAERFLKVSNPAPASKVSASYINFMSQFSEDAQKEGLQDSDSLSWNGVSLKGEVLLGKFYDLQIITNYMTATGEDERFKSLEFGVGAAYRLIDKRKFVAKLEAQLLAIPFSTYEFGSDFRKKSYGYSGGGGVNLSYLLGDNWGLDGQAGFYYTKMMGYDLPAPYQDIEPAFIGARFGLGFSYSY